MAKYTAKDVKVLKGLEPVRKRPGMYIGSTGPEGFHHLAKEVIANSVDEAIMGRCGRIEVELLPDKRVRISDDGEGIPVDEHEDTGRSALETIMTSLHSGAKFGSDAYEGSGGLHGVGLAVVSALSEELTAEVTRDGHLYVQEYSRGKPQGDLEKRKKKSGSGTSITFRPDDEIFKKSKWRWEWLVREMKQQAFLTPAVEFKLIDSREEEEREGTNYTFYFEGGITSYVRYLTEGRDPRHDSVFYIKEKKDGVLVEASLQYTEEFESFEESFANNVNTREGGSHLSGMRSAVTRSLNSFAEEKKIIKKKSSRLSGRDTRQGLTSIISVKVNEPEFEGQTKKKLGNTEVRGIVRSVVSEALSDWLEQNSSDARSILEGCVKAQKARQAAKKARDTVFKKNISRFLALPGKLSDCSSRDPEKKELFIVEGQSAGGCFSGDTKVSLVDGREVTFKELVREHEEGIENFCYTIRNDGKIGVEKISNPRLTKKDAGVVKVTLDNGEEIVCTPDHRFMLRDGIYKEATNLESGDSLMPLYRKMSDKNEKNITIDDYEMVLDPKSETWLHVLSGNRCKGVDGEHYPYMSFHGNKEEMLSCAEKVNHKVASVEHLEEKKDVYDVEVGGTHNFALSSGVFVHNSAKQGRDRRFQAILPQRGKVLNVEKARLDRILKSKEIKYLLIALGTSVGEDFDIEKLRYHRIIIMADADVDGMHIRTLLLTLFFRYLRPLIDKGYVYVAQPPLYQITQGKKSEYAYTEEDKERIVKEFKKGGKSVHIQRYKGLGEMNSEQLWETTMNPENRILKQVQIEDAEEADRVFDDLMGSKVKPRKRFIQLHAKGVDNLDV